MHNSQRMCLALYGNKMLRLWNLLDARCIFKKKVGILEEDKDSDDEEDDDNSEDDVQTKQNAELLAGKFQNSPELVKWEPRQGQLYAVLFDRLLEIFSVDSDEVLHQISFDTIQTGFEFVTSDSVVVTDEKGRLTLLTKVDKPESI